MIRLLGKQLRSRKPRPRSLKTHRKNSMSADNLDLSRMQHSVWDTERRYGETRNPDSPRFSLPPPTQLQRKVPGHQRLRTACLGAHLVPHTLPIIEFATRRTSTPNTIFAGNFPMFTKLKVCNTVARQTFAKHEKQCLLVKNKSHLVSQKKEENRPGQLRTPIPSLPAVTAQKPGLATGGTAFLARVKRLGNGRARSGTPSPPTAPPPCQRTPTATADTAAAHATTSPPITPPPFDVARSTFKRLLCSCTCSNECCRWRIVRSDAFVLA